MSGSPAVAQGAHSKHADRGPNRTGSPRAAILLIALIWLTCAASVHAQVFSVGAALGANASSTHPRIDFGVMGAVVDATTVDLKVSLDDALQLDLGLRANETFGPLGNVIFEAQFALRSDGVATGTLGARGVLGPVAVGLTLSAFGADATTFDPLAIAADDRPSFGRSGSAPSGWGLALRGSGRPARDLIIEAAPAYYATTADSAWRLDTRVRWLRAVGAHELSWRGHGYVEPGGGSAAGAVGVGFTVERRRAPDLDFAVYLGRSPSGWLPGLTADLAENLGGGVAGRLRLELEPYRMDVAPYRLRMDLTLPTDLGDVTAQAAAAAGRGPTGAALRIGLNIPVQLPQRQR